VDKEGRAPATTKKLRWLVARTDRDLGDRPIRQIEAPDIPRSLRKVEPNGTYETASRLLSLIGSIFRYAVATLRAPHDPSEALKGAVIRHRVKSRAALLNRKSIGEFLVRPGDFTGQPTNRLGLNLLVLLVPRPSELRLAKWEEIYVEEAVWRVPASRMKMRRPHRVPLPPQALRLLEKLRRTSGTSVYLFPSSRLWKTPISRNTFNAALRRLGYGKKEQFGYGLRATFSTFANESGFRNSDAVERALAHVEANDVRRAYVRREY
jgi:integrase